MWNWTFPGSSRPLAERPFLFLAAVISLGLIASGGIYYATSGDTIDTDVFPDRLPTRAELHKGEALRTVEFYPDGISPRHGIANNEDGSLTDFWYRPDGTLNYAETVRELEGGKRMVLRHADVMPDGVTYKYDAEFYEDGAKKKVTVLTAPNTLHRQYFHANGAVHADQVVVYEARKGWKLSTESRFRADSSLEAEFKSLDNDAAERKRYNANGVLVATTSVGPWNSVYHEITYADDGKTKLRDFLQDHTHTEVTNFRADGTELDQHKWFGPVNNAVMEVTEFDTKGIRVLNQNWMPVSQGGPLRIYTITTFRPDGKDDARHIYFEIGGAVSETIYIGDGSKWTRRLFRANGTLEKEFDHEAGKGAVATRDYTEADNIRIDFPKTWLVMKPYTTPEQIVPYVPQSSH